MSDESFSRELLGVQARLRPRSTFREVQFGLPHSIAPVFRVSAAKLVKESAYFRRVLDLEATKPENEDATVVTLNYMNVLPGILRILLSWVETGELLETHTLAEYSTIPVEEDYSPWMIMLRVYQTANKFEMPVLKAAVMYKIFEMVCARGTVPYGMLKPIYLLTKPGDGLRKLMVDLTAYKVPSAVYQAEWAEWGLEIIQDLLLAAKEAKDARGQEPYAEGLEEYISMY